jgi:hypothetical protein
MEYMLRQIDAHGDDAYWQMVEAMLYQVNGLDDAYTMIRQGEYEVC